MFHIIASHSDSPSLKIKENPEMVENGYVKLNVELYGGALLAPWFDRPLFCGWTCDREGERTDLREAGDSGQGYADDPQSGHSYEP